MYQVQTNADKRIQGEATTRLLNLCLNMMVVVTWIELQQLIYSMFVFHISGIFIPVLLNDNQRSTIESIAQIPMLYDYLLFSLTSGLAMLI